MAKINLLPWRESLRQTQKQQYLISLGILAIAVFGLFWLIGQIIDQQIRNQNARNTYLTQELAVLDQQINEIQRIKEAKEEIVLRMSLIEQLQVSRNVTPVLFEELARTLPAGVSFNSLSRKDNNLKIIGISESNNRLSAFVRSLEQSDVFINPVLSSIVADASTSNAISDFELTLSLSPRYAPIEMQTESQTGGR
ncbi:PilN domain-containing protein [Glaciecola sp. XM2]|uniref:PilN domain-containing protein n=1 Tax=Glaciecola sp. XM2 TaxID=1914931 RepID=UPI001BDE116D|nr:PilN domain-containing protein [Glaciecola sp. XM2]MBT1449836.1 PilN domain-containing protein [Glaciecola sp. XM2]